MTDWNKINLDDLQFSICGDEITEHGDHVFIPVQVLGPDGEEILKRPASLKADFYEQLKTQDGWRDHLHAICRSRMTQEILKLKSQAKIPIEDKISLFNEPPQKL